MIQPMNKKILKNMKSYMFLTLFLCIGIFVFDTNTVSASTHLEETKLQIIDNAVGRYELNYTGNTNHFTTWYESGDVNKQYIYNDVGGRLDNSSSACLTSRSENSTIKHAFLVWQSKTTEKEGFVPMEDPVIFIDPSNVAYPITPQYIIKDNRDNWDGQNHDNYGSICTMVTDVTSIVRSAGFGKYSVCNIPIWEPSSASRLSNGTYPAGESPGSWQLIIVEESIDFNVKAVSLSVTSEFHLATDFTGSLVLENGLKSTTIGSADGQFLFGMVRADISASVTEYISTKDSHGNVLANVLGQALNKPGLYRNGVLRNSRDTANGGVCVDLSDIVNIGNGATTAELYVANDTLWTAFTMLGASFDISYPNFEGIQTTTVNDDATKVTVEGSFKNIAVTADTGIYDGNLEIIVDEGLTPISATAKVNGTPITTAPTIKGNVVKFSGSEVRNMMNGDDICYTVVCTANRAGTLKYNNEAQFNGKLRSEGANTGYWVDQMWVASSKWEREVYQITLDNQSATTAGTSSYFEWYNHGNYTTEGCLQAIDSITVPNRDNYNFNGYYTGKNGGGTKYVDTDGRILSDVTTFTADTTLYAYWTPKIYKITLDNQGAKTAGTAVYYEKYGAGNYADEACTVGITKIAVPVKTGYTFAGYFTEPEGKGTQYVLANGNICMQNTWVTKDTTIYAHWTPDTYTIILDNQGASFSGSTYFNELYATNFYYDKTVLTSGTTDIPYNYTGGVQYFVAPYTGTYKLEVWGAQGGAVRNYNSGMWADGGLGGYASGTIDLIQGETLYIYIGGQPAARTDPTKAEYTGLENYNSAQLPGGWNGGGPSANWSDGNGHMGGGGGGATDIRRSPNDIYHRIIVGGGGGGATALTTLAVAGGAGGNQNPYDLSAIYQYEIRQNMYPPLTERQLYQGTDVASGGGYYGGVLYYRNTALSDYYYMVAGEGGSSYTDGLLNAVQTAGVRSGNGYAVITRSNYGTQYTTTTKIEPPTREGYTFMGYFTGYNGTGTQVADARGNITVSTDYFTANTTVYAYWIAGAVAIPDTYVVHFNGNGATSGSMSSMVCNVGQTYQLHANAFIRENYAFAGWAVAPTGGVTYANAQQFNQSTFGLSTGGSITLYAVWKPIEYTIRFNGNGATSGSMTDMNCTYGQTYTLPEAAYKKDGYYFAKWTTNPDGSGTAYADKASVKNLTTAENGIVTLYAQWEANSYTIVFHPNDGAEVTHIGDITVKYGDIITVPDMTLPDGTYYYVKYTLDGVNVTEQVLSKAIVLSADGTVVYQGEPLPEGSGVANDGTITYPDGTMVSPNGIITSPDGIVTYPDGNVVYPDDTDAEAQEEAEEFEESAEENGAQTATVTVEVKEVSRVGNPEDEAAEQVENPDEEPQPDKKAYASVFKGWSLEEGKADFEPQWKPGNEIEVSTLINAAGVTNQNGATITLYAVWDDCPWITATHLYYTLEQAQSGFITDTEILSHMTAYDREDGSPIEPGFHEDGTSFSIPDYAAADFTQFQHEGSCTENLTVVDSAGSVYAKQITVYVVDTTPVAVKPEETTRFIDEYYYNQSYENGGLEENSIWLKDSEYVSVIRETFDNINNDRAIMTYYLTHDEILEWQQSILSDEAEEQQTN